VSGPALPLPCSAADHLALARRQVAPGLVAEAAWGTLRRLGDPLPPVAEEAAVEVRLTEGEPRADFALGLRAVGARRAALADTLEASSGGSPSPGWRRALGFLRTWARPASPLHEAVHAVWLEFDAEGPGTPEPFLIFSLDGERLYAGGRAAPEALLAPLRAGLDLLAEGLDAATRATLERTVRELPPYAQLRHAAMRPTAGGDALRLVLRLPWRRLPATLGRLGWRGDPDGLYALLAGLCPETLVHPVNLDLLPEGIGPRVGIEFVHAGAPRQSPRWKALLDRLEALGACAPSRRMALGDWGGGVPGPPLGPGRLEVRRDLMVKVVHEEGRGPSAKAYLGFAPRLVLPAARAGA